MTTTDPIEHAPKQPLPWDGLDIDSLDEAAIDALDFGVIKVDRNGRILLFNRFEAEMSGRKPERVLGRNFFLEVAPCTRVPHFYGRFRRGVEQGHLHERLNYSYDFDFRTPVIADIEMRNSKDDDAYWVLASVRARHDRRIGAKPDRLIAEKSQSYGTRLEACESEAIHSPDSVQPWAALVVLCRETQIIQATSQNFDQILRTNMQANLNGSPARDLFEDEDIERFLSVSDDARAGFPDEQVHRCFVKACPERVELRTTRKDRLLFIEISIADERIGHHIPSFHLSNLISGLQRAATLESLYQRAADAVRSLSGFQRVLIYKFDSAWNGHAIAESLEPGTLVSLLGLHFPESDIPRQARDMYIRNKARYNPTRDFVPVPVRFLDDSRRDSRNLSNVHVRTPSPVHRMYHRNIGVNGSMSMSIVIGGKLWGLLIAHHRLPHHVDQEAKMLVTQVFDTFVAQMRTMLVDTERHNLMNERRMQIALMEALNASGDILASDGQSDADSCLLSLFGCRSVAILSGRRIKTLGDAPPDSAIRAVHRYAQEHRTSSVWTSHCLSDETPQMRGHKDRASGAIVVIPESIDGTSIIWFLPERIRVYDWAGRPRTKNEIGEVEGRTTYLPRVSFERWTQVTEGHSGDIPAYMLEIADSIGASVSRFLASRNERLVQLNSALTDSNRHLAALVDSIPEAVVGFQETGQITSLNDRARQLFLLEGVDRTELCLRDFVGEEGVRFLQAHSGAPDSAVTEEFLVERRDRSHIAVRLSAGWWETDQGLEGVLILKDETRRRFLERLSLQRSRLEALGQFAGSVAHDFNNFLSIISGNIQLASLAVDDKDVLQKLQSADHAVRRGAELTDRLLGLVRERPPHLVEVDLADTIQRNAPLFRSTAGNSIALTLEIDSTLGTVRTESGLIENVLINLLNNARDAIFQARSTTPAKSGEIDGEIIIRLRPAPPPAVACALLEVSDTGCGIDPDEKARILEPFYSSKPPGKGTGLGLSTVVRLMGVSNGQLTIDSTPGKGTTVSLLLPLDQAGASPSERGDLSAHGAPNRRLLLVDDDDAVLRPTASILRSHGFDVTVADSVETAKTLLLAPDSFDILLTDIDLKSEQTGFDLAEWALAQTSICQVVALSGQASSMPASLRDRVTMLQKPFQIGSFLAALRAETPKSGPLVQTDTA